MNWTTEELELLKTNAWIVSSESSAHRSGNSYQNYNLKKQDDELILYQGFYATNVDCDDGSYDTEHFKETYLTLEDFVENKNPLKKENYTT